MLGDQFALVAGVVVGGVVDGFTGAGVQDRGKLADTAIRFHGFNNAVRQGDGDQVAATAAGDGALGAGFIVDKVLAHDLPLFLA